MKLRPTLVKILHAKPKQLLWLLILTLIFSFQVQLRTVNAALVSFTSAIVSTGLPPFDALDANNSNTDIRNGDYVNYRVTYTSDATGLGNNVFLTLTLPRCDTSTPAPCTPPAYTGAPIVYPMGWEASSLASICQNRVFPPTVPNATQSGISADRQTLTCRVGNVVNATTQSIDFRAVVYNDVPNGSTLEMLNATIASDSLPSQAAVVDPTIPLGWSDLTTRSAPRWDVRKTIIYGQGVQYLAGSGPAGEDGFAVPVSISIFSQGSRVGLEGLQPNVTIIDDISSMPAGTQLVTWALPGSRWPSSIASRGCVGNGQVTGVPLDYHPTARDYETLSSLRYVVRNGGVCSATQSGTTITLNITGLDSSLRHFPTYNGNNSGLIVDPLNPTTSTNLYYAAAKIFWLWVPRDSLPMGTTNVPNRANISSGGTQLAGVTMNSVTGQVNVEPNFTTGTGTNNVYTYQFVRSNAGTFSKDIDALDAYGTLNNPLWTVRNPTTFTSAVDGQYYTASIYLRNSSTEGDLTNVLLCDKVDNTRQTYADANSAPLNTLTPGVNLQVLPIGSFLAIIDNDIASNARLTTAEIASAGITFTSQLGVGGIDGAGETWASYSLVAGSSGSAINNSDHGLGGCNDADSPIWFDSVADLLAYDGADADSDPDYTLQDVTKVRVKLNKLPDNFIAILYLRILVRSTYAFDTTDVSVNSPLSHIAGDSTLGDYAANQGWAIYDGRSAFRENQVYLIDRIISPRVSKSSTNYPTLNQLIMAGSTIDYQLRVGAVTNGPATTANLTVTDVLPPGVNYVNGSSTFAGNPITPQVFANDPAAGYTRLVYNLINRTIPYGSNGSTISYNQGNINFQASTDITLLDGAAILNSATIDTALNPTADCTYTVGTGFGPATCIFSNWTLEIDNPPGFRIVKAVDQTLVEPDTSFNYTLQW
ncbi:MAG TPA: hypothetical protein PK299_04775, partial [Anaerolineales bacterium]|nr:hypothetical protein [Anaerolineales bacterium]